MPKSERSLTKKWSLQARAEREKEAAERARREAYFELTVSIAVRELPKLRASSTLTLSSYLTQRAIGELHRDPDRLVCSASRDWYSREALRLGLADLLKRNCALPEAGKAWLIEYLEGRAPEPKGRRGRPKNFQEQMAIANMVQQLIDTKPPAGTPSMPAMRNDDSDPFSACDAVALAIERLDGRPYSFDAVKNIWNDAKLIGHKEL